MAVGQRAADLKAGVEIDERPPGEHRADSVDHLDRQVGEVAKVLVADLAALPEGAPQEMRRVDATALAFGLDCGYVN